MREREEAKISSSFVSEGRAQQITIDITEKGRTASLNKGTSLKASSLAGTLCCVVFSPEHLELVKGSPERRRRFIDTALCQISPSYLNNLKVYTRLLSQRNSLLKDSAYISAASEMLDVYDERFAQSASAITESRRIFIEELLPLAVRSYSAVSGGRETLSFYYESTLFGTGESDPDEALLRLVRNRNLEQKCGFTMAGPHRDDIVIELDNEDSKIFASQGQQRCIVLSLKLAEAELMELRLGERPVLLLDDVLSELDPGRRDFLTSSIEDTQAFISCCEPELVLERADARAFLMKDGCLSEV